MRVKKHMPKRKLENLKKEGGLTPEVVDIKKEALYSSADGISLEKDKSNSGSALHLDPLNLDPQHVGEDCKEIMKNQDEVIFSDRAEDMRLIVCNLCHKPNSCLRNHVRTKHNMVIADFRKLYPETIFSCQTFHR